MSTTTFITIPCTASDGSPLDPDTYLVDTDAQTAEAKRAMRDAGIESAPVWAGEPEEGESVATGQVLYAGTIEDDARATGWKPTHRIVTRQNGAGAPETVDVCLHDGVAYTAHEWASQADADWEVSDEGDWLYRGAEYPGAWEVTEI